MDIALEKIKVTPLAAESFGVRSMCTLVETPDMVVLLDAGVSLCPYRFGLPPHTIEFQRIAHLRQVIAEAANKATITTISHYHFDHHTPSYTDWIVNWTDGSETARQIYQGKKVFIKNPKENINASQRQRAWMFMKTGGKYANSVVEADGKTFQFGNTALRFSQAMAHGVEGGILGWVITTTIDCCGERFMHAPDVQGPMSTRTTNFIISAKPTVIMLGGPPLYLAGFRVEQSQLDLGLINLEQIVSVVPLVVLEHHTLRDKFWRSKMDKIFQKAQFSGHKIVTAAEFAGKEELFLEANRKKLFQDHPVSEEFNQWTKTLNFSEIAKPPI